MEAMQPIPYVQDKKEAKGEKKKEEEEEGAKEEAKEETEERPKYDYRILSAEIVGLESVSNADPECTGSFKELTATLMSMGNCAAKSATAAASAVWNSDGLWKLALDPQTRAHMEVPLLDEGKVEQFGQIAYRTLRQCTCVPSPTATTMVQALIGTYRATRKDVFLANRSQASFRAPLPMRFRGDRMALEADGHVLLIRLPLRTGELCPWATKGWYEKNKKLVARGERPPCVERRWTTEEEGPEGKKREVQHVLAPLRGHEGKNVTAVLRCVVTGARSHALLKALMEGAVQYRDLQITRQGGNGRKTCWMARLSYRAPKPLASGAKGVAALVFSHSYALYLATNEGRTLSNFQARALRAKGQMFDGIEAVAHHLEAMRKKKDEEFQKKREARWALSYASPGARGHGKKRLFRSVRDAERAEHNWMSTQARKLGAAVREFCLKYRIGTILVEEWTDATDIEDIPRDKRHLILHFPRALIRESVRFAVAKIGVGLEVVKRQKVRCPQCGEDLPWNENGNSRCVCGFFVKRDYLRCLNVLLGSKVKGAKELYKEMLERDEKEKRATARAKQARAAKEVRKS